MHCPCSNTWPFYGVARRSKNAFICLSFSFSIVFRSSSVKPPKLNSRFFIFFSGWSTLTQDQIVEAR
jgi:hypothetical protein